MNTNECYQYLRFYIGVCTCGNSDPQPVKSRNLINISLFPFVDKWRAPGSYAFVGEGKRAIMLYLCVLREPS